MATPLSRIAWVPTLSCVLSASVLVAAVSSSLVNLQGADVVRPADSSGSAPAMRVELTSETVATSWSADGQPGFLDLSRPVGSPWTLAVVPSGPGPGTLAVEVCGQPWGADGTCAVASHELLAPASLTQLASGTALELGPGVIAHLRVTLTSAASLLLSPA